MDIRDTTIANVYICICTYYEPWLVTNITEVIPETPLIVTNKKCQI